MLAAVLIVSWSGCSPPDEPRIELPPLQEDDPLPGQVVLHPSNASLLALAEGDPIFVCGPGDPESFLYLGDRNPDGTRSGGMQAELIEKLAGTGANTVYIQAVRSHGGDGEPTHNPFHGSNPSRGVNPRILDQWDGWIGALNEAGVVVFFFLYDDSARVWRTGDRVRFRERDFIRSIVDRLERHPLLVWVVAEEYEERYSPERVRAIAREIRFADDHDHLIAVHKLSGLDFDEFADVPVIDQFAVQWEGPEERIHEGMLEMRRRYGGAKNVILAEAAAHGSGEEARRKNWAAAFGGAAGVLVYEMDIASTDPSDLGDCGRLRDFMESVHLGSLQPRPALAVGDSRVLADPAGSTRLIHTSVPGERIETASMPAGSYEVRWFDPVAGWMEEQIVRAEGDLALERPEGLRNGEAALRIRPADRARGSGGGTSAADGSPSVTSR